MELQAFFFFFFFLGGGGGGGGGAFMGLGFRVQPRPRLMLHLRHLELKAAATSHVEHPGR